ncbi:MAG: U32 family peptidase [Spirochaetales bacterium]|jgi:U32 family peptidase|nr:U32 family peptidase [Spirochaetales bacterium]
MNKPELLAPAGNIEKLKTAYKYGADAAYIGTRDYSLRSRADNFEADSAEELKVIKGSKKLFGALNIYFHDDDLEQVEKQIEDLKRYPFDGLIVSDPGAAALLRRLLPNMPLHLSTQANCLNSEAVKWYRDAGFKRIILGRELNLRQIEKIRKAVPDVELETFVHGAMCWAYSGRCYLSSFLSSRSANKGDCAHSCRWEYRVLEEKKRPGEYLPVIEGDGFTTVLSSKDLFMLDHLKSLAETGIDSMKIEGRMKSIYYAAVVTRAYRKAIDSLTGSDSTDISGYRDELFKASHREYSTGFYFDDPNAIAPNESEYKRDYVFLGTIGERVEPCVYEIDVKNQIRREDTIEYIGPDILFIEDQDFDLLDETRTIAEKANHGHTHFLRTEKEIEPGYIIRKEKSY